MSLANVSKGDTVVLIGFTGIRLADVVVTKATKSEIEVENKSKGTTMVFDRKTGVQKNVEEGKEKYANKIVHPDDAPAPKAKKAKAAAAPKKASKKAPEPEEVEDEEEEEEDEEEEEEEKPAPKKKSKSKAKAKKDEDEDDDDYEEM